MMMKLTLLAFVSILQLSGFVSALSDSPEVMVCGRSEGGFEGEFMIAADHLGYEATHIPGHKYNGKCDLETTLNLAYYHEVVINFDVEYFGHSDYKLEDELNGYDGDMIADQYGVINDLLPSCEEKDNQNQTDVYERNCKDPGFNQFTKIFIGSFEKHQALYNIYNKITNTSINRNIYRNVNDNVKQIVVCKDNPKHCPVYKGFLISCIRCDTEFECTQNTIAIIAPSPDKLKTCNDNIPVMFYDTLYTEPNSVGTVYEGMSDFKTSTAMMHWRALASGFVKFIHNKYHNLWPRVAVVSDDSLLSHYTTSELKKYFEDTKTLFTIIQDCVEETEFKEALAFLKKYESRVIIVNVAKQNLNKFIKGARALDMTDADILWVFPGHRESDIKYFKFRSFAYLTTALEEVVHRVIELYPNHIYPEHRQADIFKESLRNHLAFESCKSPMCHFTGTIPPVVPPMGLGNCALPTSDYFHYCADWNVLYMILAIIVFLVLIFGVLLLFNHVQMNTLAYKPLHRPPPFWRQILRRERPPPRQGFAMRRRF